MFPVAGSPPSSESSSKTKVNLAVLLQVNATIIVGLFIFLTLSDGIFFPNVPEFPEVDLPVIDILSFILDVTSDPDLASNPELRNYTMQLLDLSQQQQMLKDQYNTNIQRYNDLGQALMLGFTAFVISPFVFSSVLILAFYFNESNPESNRGRVNRWRVEKWPVISTIVGMLGVVAFFIFWQYSIIFGG
ncbi:MAG: hypothetical protein ACRD8W_04185 [Nitrososphaeraceae archaeon]